MSWFQSLPFSSPSRILWAPHYGYVLSGLLLFELSTPSPRLGRVLLRNISIIQRVPGAGINQYHKVLVADLTLILYLGCRHREWQHDQRRDSTASKRAGEESRVRARRRYTAGLKDELSVPPLALGHKQRWKYVYSIRHAVFEHPYELLA